VALHASALTRLPTSRGSHAEWEAAARLVLEGTPRAWDMLGVSSMSASAPASGGPEWFVHETTLSGLPAGTYRLGAFVRDRSVNLFGGASSVLDLPDPRSEEAVGPIPLLAGRSILTTVLPQQPASPGEGTRGVLPPSGLVPSGEAMTGEQGGPPLAIMTWLCGAGGPSAAVPAPERHLSFEDAVVMTFPPKGEWTDAGACRRWSDTVEAGLLDDAPYRYHLRWNRSGGAPVEVDVELP
jgi:hypothetical protein